MAATTLLSAIHVYTLECMATGSISEMTRQNLYISEASYCSRSSNVDSFSLYKWDNTNKITLSEETLCLIFCEYGVCVGIGSKSPMKAVRGCTLFYTKTISYVEIYGHEESNEESNTIYISFLF